jgi:hypothetical protein
VPSEDDDINAPPNLTQIEMEDGGNEGGEGDPGAVAQGGRAQEERGTVRVRDIEGKRTWLARSSILATINSLRSLGTASIATMDVTWMGVLWMMASGRGGTTMWYHTHT